MNIKNDSQVKYKHQFQYQYAMCIVECATLERLYLLHAERHTHDQIETLSEGLILAAPSCRSNLIYYSMEATNKV